MALVSDALTTLAEFKNHMDVPGANTDFDMKFERVINASSDRIKAFCDRNFARQTYTERYSGKGRQDFPLRQTPVESVTKVVISQTWDFSGTPENPADYEVSGGQVLVRRNGSWSKGRLNIEVEYIAGFYLPSDALNRSLPHDLEYSCLLFAEFLYEQRRDRRLGQSSKGKQDESVSYVDGIPSQIAEMLEPFRHMQIGDIYD